MNAPQITKDFIRSHSSLLLERVGTDATVDDAEFNSVISGFDVDMRMLLAQERIDAHADENAPERQPARSKLPVEVVKWPAEPGEDAIRVLLNAWAADRKTVGKNFFVDRELRIEFESSAEYTLRQVIESRRLEDRQIPGTIERGAGTYKGNFDRVRLVAPTEFVNQTIELVDDKSVVVHQCPTCHRGAVACPRCEGSRFVSCDPSENCRKCSGTGRVGETRDGEVRYSDCHMCRGVGEVSCKRCKGKGRIKCSHCGAKGKVSCSDCAGSSRITTCRVGIARRSVRDQSVASPITPFEKKTAVEGSQPILAAFTGLQVPQGVPETEARSVSALVENAPDDLLRALVVATTPITTVTYDRRGQDRQLYVTGADRKVTAPDLQTRSTFFVYAALAALVAAVVVFYVAQTAGWL